ncbi:hypothetical protein M9978_22615 [Sphingomonas sp. MG17]|uniref:Lysozyme inhibitor LprI N-terminal domain-containing protein n=1 Tax=Sphingomonas tagetis TaxID=2949092 RepID=A0A9X2HL30_9SPHN|nr:hypothetical protein [Sphingomonas tagetis]MCP3733201.1 hypothetical protein [Sphingomonas tagetis]
MKLRLFLALLATPTIAGCERVGTKTEKAGEPSAQEERASAARLKRACASAQTYASLKALVFDEAVRVRRAESPTLRQLADASIIRMEAPVATGRDPALNITVCEGRFILELPPGSADVFDGDQRLQADVEYSAQEAADGSGLVYQMKGAEPIVYRLAALDLTSPRPGPAAQPTQADIPVTAPTQPPAVEDESPPVSPPRTGPSSVPAPARQEAQAPPKAGPARVQGSTRPSFNCRYARSRVEKIICSSATLAKHDRQMSSAFYSALARADAPTRAKLRASRDRFLGARDRCDSEACIATSYRQRMAEIERIAD